MSHVADKQSILNLAMTKQKEIIRKEFSENELHDMKDRVTKNLFQYTDLEEELQEIKDSFKTKMKPLKKENGLLLKDIRNGFVDQNIEVYLVPDYDNKIMELFNEEGEKVGERRMMMSELQGRLDLK